MQIRTLALIPLMATIILAFPIRDRGQAESYGKALDKVERHQTEMDGAVKALGQPGLSKEEAAGHKEIYDKAFEGRSAAERVLDDIEGKIVRE
jgi:hypothetical protein